ncbi:MAG: response regulator transcription factor [Methylococcales bacterium]|nr:response regulator transcription factor [Methylococcales bacterium]
MKQPPIMSIDKTALSLLRPLNALLAEDDAALNASLQRLLGQFFHSVLTTERGDDAWHVFMREPVQCVFLDIRMPGLSGLEVARRIRARSQDIPVVMLSAHQETPDLLAAASLYLVDYLVKPIAFDRLQPVLLKIGEQVKLRGLGQWPLALGVTYNPANHSVTEQGVTRCVLTSKEALLLELLLQHAGTLVALATIEQQIYPDGMSLGALRNLVLRLRHKLGIYDRIVVFRDCGYSWQN